MKPPSPSPLTPLTLTLTLTLLGTTTTAQLTGFTSTCLVSTVKVDGRWLTAQCHNILGTETRCSKLDLNSCLKNNSGRLEDDVFGTGPHFTDRNQCINCSNKKPAGGFIIGNGNAYTQVNCQCNPGTGAAQANWATTVIDLDDFVDNNNGVLECHGKKGTAC